MLSYPIFVMKWTSSVLHYPECFATQADQRRIQENCIANFRLSSSTSSWRFLNTPNYCGKISPVHFRMTFPTPSAISALCAADKYLKRHRQENTNFTARSATVPYIFAEWPHPTRPATQPNTETDTICLHASFAFNTRICKNIWKWNWSKATRMNIKKKRKRAANKTENVIK